MFDIGYGMQGHRLFDRSLSDQIYILQFLDKHQRQYFTTACCTMIYKYKYFFKAIALTINFPVYYLLLLIIQEQHVAYGKQLSGDFQTSL
ncbi:hypothetical protein D3C75_1214700 [compost metagenome]